MQSKMFQPGLVLYEVVTGALRTKGITFKEWCDNNLVDQWVARDALYGKSHGPQGTDLVKRMIDFAGFETVRVAYTARIEAEAAHLRAEAAYTKGAA